MPCFTLHFWDDQRLLVLLLTGWFYIQYLTQWLSRDLHPNTTAASFSVHISQNLLSPSCVTYVNVVTTGYWGQSTINSMISVINWIPCLYFDIFILMDHMLLPVFVLFQLLLKMPEICLNATSRFIVASGSHWNSASHSETREQERPGPGNQDCSGNSVPSVFVSCYSAVPARLHLSDNVIMAV